MTILYPVDVSEVLMSLSEAILISKAEAMVETLVIRFPSLASAWYLENEMNPIVQSIAKIVMTTMSSTRVKPLIFLKVIPFVFFVDFIDEKEGIKEYKSD